MMECRVINLDFDRIGDLCDLYQLAFNKKLNPKVIEWKYFNNPAGNAIWKGIIYNNNLVASGAMVPEQLFVFSKKTIAFKCTDLMVHPKHQGKGLARQINNALKEQVNTHKNSLAYTLCSKKATPSFLKNGWVKIAELQNYFKPFFLLKISGLHKNNFNNFFEKDTIDNELNDFIFHVDTSRVHMEKSIAVLKWRIRNPNFSYRIIYHNNNNKIDGYIIYCVNSNNILNIIDLETINVDKSLTNKLIRLIEIKAVELKCKGVVCCLVEKSRYHKMFLTNFYLKNPFPKGPLASHIDFNVFSDGGYARDIFNIQSWEIFTINYDDI